jgi:hypothetical protein
MPSPFPGMDPWLEDEEVFPDLHERFAVYLSEVLNGAMPAGYVARTRNKVWVDDELRREPDVSTFGPDRPQPESSGSVATLPGLVAVGRDRTSDPVEEPFLEIVSPKGKRLVTAVEIISLTNKKAGEKGRKSYRAKQDEYLAGGVNLVEIDLLRTGPHVTAVSLPRLRRVAGPFDYHVSVAVPSSREGFYAAAIKLSDRLPAFAFPLDPDVPPVTVDLQPLLDRSYVAGRYADEVRYDLPPDPPLSPEHQAWAEGILREKGLLK